MRSMTLARKLPEACGYSASGIMDAVYSLEKTGFEVHSLLICASSSVIFEAHYLPYHRDSPHLLHSLTKAFTNIAIGMLVEDGLLSLSDRVAGFFPEYRNDDPRFARMTVENLITMRNGHGRMISGNEWRPIHSSWIERFFAEPVVHEPGSVFQYSSGNSHILSAIVQRVSGETTRAFLDRRLFRPMGILNYTWDSSPDGVNPGGNGLSMTAEDLAKLGILMLNNGVWENKRLISEDWVMRCFGMIDRKPLADGRSYGYHWWDLGFGWLASGAFGQSVLVMPELDIVVAMTAGSAAPADKALGVLRDRLVAARLTGPADPEQVPYAAWQRSRNLLTRLDPPRCAVADRRYEMYPNSYGITEVSWKIEGNVIRFCLSDGKGSHTVMCGIGCYVTAETDIPGAELHHQYDFGMTTCCAGASIVENAIHMFWYFPATPFHDWVTLETEGDMLCMRRGTNVNSQAMEMDLITGRSITDT